MNCLSGKVGVCGKKERLTDDGVGRLFFLVFLMDETLQQGQKYSFLGNSVVLFCFL